MNTKIEATATFERFFKKLARKYKSLPDDLIKLKLELLENPNKGIDLGNNIRKIRLAIKSKGKGKSGGARVITYKNVLYEISENRIILVIIYDKSKKNTITKQDILILMKKEGIIE